MPIPTFANDTTRVDVKQREEVRDRLWVDIDGNLKEYDDLSEKGRELADRTMLYEGDKSLELSSPEFDALMLGRSVATAVGKSVLKGTAEIPIEKGSYYRVVGKDAVKDAQKSGVVRPPKDGPRMDMEDILRASKYAGKTPAEIQAMTSDEQLAMIEAIKANKDIPLREKLFRLKSNHGDAGFAKEGFFYEPKLNETTAVIKGTEGKSTFLQGHHASYTGKVNGEIPTQKAAVLRGGEEAKNFTKFEKAPLGGWVETKLTETIPERIAKDAASASIPTTADWLQGIVNKQRK